MPKKIDFTLTEIELSTIEESIKRSKSARVVKRATAIGMLHRGQPPQQVSEILSVSQSTIYEWFHQFRSEGLEGLEHRPKSGRPPIADETYCQVVEETLEQEPYDLGYEFTVWTIKRLNQHVSLATGTEISDERLRLILLKRGWVYRRPKEDLEAKQDKEAREWAEEFLEELKKGRSSKKISNSSLWTKRP